MKLALFVAALLPALAAKASDAWPLIAPYFQPPAEFAEQFGAYRTPLKFDDGSPVMTEAQWPRRREEILQAWQRMMGPWPPLVRKPRVDYLAQTHRENFTQHRLRLELAPGQSGDAWLLIPDGGGPFPAVLIVYYEPETSIGLGKELWRDFGLQLARRGFVTLSLGTPGGNAWRPEMGAAQCQPLSFHAYVAANAWQALANRPEVDSNRIGVVGHSYGGKWALFAGAFWERFACVAVSDPGIVFDESRPNVNYWEPWYLGWDAVEQRPARGLPTAQNPRTGAYRKMMETGRDLHELHALIAPRPFFVSGGSEDPPSRWIALNHAIAVNNLLGRTNRVAMTNRKEHTPNEDSNARLYAFFEYFLKQGPSGNAVVETAGRMADERLRLVVETDAGGDPDDEQSLVRLLVYANEFDIEGIIANRPRSREGENKNSERTGLGVVRRLLRAYAECFPHLRQHDSRYPPPERLLARTVAGYDETDEAVKLIVAAVDNADPRPVWYSDWGTDNGTATNNLRRALDRVRRERGPEGYARFKERLRLSSFDKFGEHTATITPPFSLWVDTFRPELDRRRWYHRFSALTARAGGFDLERDVRTGHGALGALYPTNTTHWCKEGDTMTFLYLVPTGLNDPNQPTWGSWAGRYGLNTNFAGRAYFWANAADTWQGQTNRDNTLARWAESLQNDFRARMDWCVKDFAHANHPPVARVRGGLTRTLKSGERMDLDASESSDPDGQSLSFEWFYYSEPGSYRGTPVEIRDASLARASFVAPRVESAQTIHLVLAVTDGGTPPLTRYQRLVLTIQTSLGVSQ